MGSEHTPLEGVFLPGIFDSIFVRNSTCLYPKIGVGAVKCYEETLQSCWTFWLVSCTVGGCTNSSSTAPHVPLPLGVWVGQLSPNAGVPELAENFRITMGRSSVHVGFLVWHGPKQSISLS